MKTLYKYQREVVERAKCSTALFWDMGLGKTITSIEIYKKFRRTDEVNLLFVLCPISMVDEWIREFESQASGKSASFKSLRSRAKRLKISIGELIHQDEIECVVLNYDMVWRIDDYSWLDDKSMIICDESHRIKNHKSRVGKYMKFLKIKTKYKICLSGTPQSQGYIDYFNQLFFLDIIEMRLSDFKNRYCIYEDVEFNGVRIQQLQGYKNVDEFEDVYLSQCEFLKMERVYDDVVQYNYVPIPTSKQYEWVRKTRVIYYDDEENIITDRKQIDDMFKNKLSTDIVAYKCLDNPGAYRFGLRELLDSTYKHDWLRDFLQDYGKRIVIFYNFNHELHSIVDIIRRSGRPYAMYNGSDKCLDAFKDNDDGVAVVNYKSGSFGINDLVVSNCFIAYSPTDNYLEWEQSKKRIDRNGQVNTPIYYFLESGLEKRIYASLKVGKNFDDRVFVSELEENLI